MMRSVATRQVVRSLRDFNRCLRDILSWNRVMHHHVPIRLKCTISIARYPEEREGQYCLAVVVPNWMRKILSFARISKPVFIRRGPSVFSHLAQLTEQMGVPACTPSGNANNLR